MNLSLASLSLFLFSRFSLIRKGLFILFCPNNMSYEMLHHAELQIETWFEFELKTLEKKRKIN
jgi:hypothetical protein